MTNHPTTSKILDDELRQRARSLADELRDAHDLDDQLETYRPLLETSPASHVPTLHLDDFTGIPNLSGVSGVVEYQHRARTRAADGDAVATATEPAPGYETYNREILDLGEPDWVVATEGDDPFEVARAAASGKSLERLAGWARESGCVRVEPFMAIEPVWELAAELQERGADAGVLGPPPPIVEFANDKLRVTELVDRLFDERRNPTGYAESTPEAMADRLLELADRFPRVALKRICCASAMGNKVFDSAEILDAGRRETTRRVRNFLEETNWPEGRDVLLVRWLDAAVSPSTQCWIPPREAGPPSVDGIYEQLLQGGTGVFAGSRPTELPDQLETDILETSLGILTVFQELEYVGRCSFDYVVAGDPEGNYDLRMVDCNGRWGGTSLPMQLVDRLVDGERPPYRAQDFVRDELVGTEFPEILEACRNELFDPATQEGRFILYNVGPLRKHGKFDVVSLGETQEEAERGLDEVLPSLLGVS